MANKYNKIIYIVMIVAIIAASFAGYFAGQSQAPGTAPQTLTIWRTTTQVLTQTYVATLQQPLLTPTQTPTSEQLLVPIIEAARREGRLVIYSVYDRPSAEPLLNAFKAKYPFINIEYVELLTTQLYNRYVSEKAAGAPTADIIWSSAVDLQYKLIQEGSAQPYKLSIYDKIPDYGKYKDLAYMPAYVLIAPFYNKDKLPGISSPKSYSDILRLLTERKELFPPRSVIVADASRSAIHLISQYYIYRTEPALFEKLLRAAGSTGPLTISATSEMIELVKSGQALIALSAFTNYVYKANLDVIIPSDIAVVTPYIIFITKEARHPNAAKLFLEFLFSEEGQKALAEGANILVMTDNPVFPYLNFKYLQTNVKNLIILRIGDPIIDEILNPDVRNNFIKLWRSWLGLS